MNRREFIKRIGATGSFGLISGCGARTDQYVFENIRTFDYGPGINKFEVEINSGGSVKIDPQYTPVFALISPDGIIKLTNMRDTHPPDNQLGTDRQGYTISNLESSGDYQLVIGQRDYGGTVSVSQSSYTEVTQAERRTPINPETLIGMVWEDSSGRWEIERLQENDWENARKVIKNRGEITSFLTPSETYSQNIELNKAVLEEIIESNDLDIPRNSQQTYEMLIFTRKIYSILEQMRASLQKIITRLVDIFLQLLSLKFGSSYALIEEPLRESIRDAIINRLSVGMGPIVSETEDTVSYIMFLTGTSSFTMRDSTTGQEIASALPEVDITAKLKVGANIDAYFPYRIDPQSVELSDAVLVETGN